VGESEEKGKKSCFFECWMTGWTTKKVGQGMCLLVFEVLF